jgi:RUN domain
MSVQDTKEQHNHDGDHVATMTHTSGSSVVDAINSNIQTRTNAQNTSSHTSLTTAAAEPETAPGPSHATDNDDHKPDEISTKKNLNQSNTTETKSEFDSFLDLFRRDDTESSNAAAIARQKKLEAQRLLIQKQRSGFTTKIVDDVKAAVRALVIEFIQTEQKLQCDNVQESNHGSAAATDVDPAADSITESFVFDNASSELVCNLIDAVDRVLVYGVRESIGNALWGSELVFWPVLEAAAERHDPTSEFVLDFQLVDSIELSEGSKGRAWLRRLLNEHRLSDDLRKIVNSRAIILDWYEPHASLRNQETADLFVSLLDALCTVPFKLALKDLSLTKPSFKWSL